MSTRPHVSAKKMGWMEQMEDLTLVLFNAPKSKFCGAIKTGKEWTDSAIHWSVGSFMITTIYLRPLKVHVDTKM